MEKEIKYQSMTKQLMLTNSNEDVGNYIRWIIKSDTAKEYWESVQKEQQKQCEWISIEDRLPDDYQRVLFIDERDSRRMVDVGYFVLSQTKCDWLKFWQPLPQPPKTK